MSRVGKRPIAMPQGVEVFIKESNIIVKGPKGELSESILHGIIVKEEDRNLILSYYNEETDKKKENMSAFHGLYRSLIANMVTGVSSGFEKILLIEGIGYKAGVSGNTLNMSLGFSHPINYQIPEGITIEADKKGTLIVRGINKQKVGQVAADIKNYKKVEPYKGKGIRYKDEIVRRKVGKAGAK